MQIVETIKYTLSAHANDFQYFQTVVLWLLPSAFCLQMADSHPVRVSVSNEQGARSEVHCGSQHEGMEGKCQQRELLVLHLPTELLAQLCSETDQCAEK